MYYDEGEHGEEKTLVTSFYEGMPKWPGVVLPTWDMYVILSQAFMAHRPLGDPEGIVVAGAHDTGAEADRSGPLRRGGDEDLG
jgi:hypothetical protein